MDHLDFIPQSWFEEPSGQRLILDTEKVSRLIQAAMRCHQEMRNTIAPRDSFTDALDALDAALYSQS